MNTLLIEHQTPDNSALVDAFHGEAPLTNTNMADSVREARKKLLRRSLPIWDTMLSCIAGAVDVSFAQHERTNGSTVSLIHGNMVGTKLFSVSIHPSSSVTRWERPTWEELYEYAKANLDLLLRPDHAMGTWFNDLDLLHCQDVVVLVPDRNDAVELGLRWDQLAIYDLETRREIPLSRPCRKSAGRLAEVGND